MNYVSEHGHRQWLTTQAALPHGFRVGTTRFSFLPTEVPKTAYMNLTLIALERPTPDFAAVFTRNAFPGAPVIIGRRRLQEPTLGAVLINNKVSNVCAHGGIEASERLCAAVAPALGLKPEEVLPCSTGVIGWGLPVEAMIKAVPAAMTALQTASVLPAAQGIMTTDLYPKIRRAEVGGGVIVGIAKGAGMIEPNLATLLAYILTDIEMPRAALRQMLREVVSESFNCISIDSDQSTSDTVVALSSGHVAGVSEAAFHEALGRVCRDLAEDVVRNGEGVHHVMKVTVRGAPDAALARAVGKAVVNSPLLQCALCGNDPNIGRLVCAVGKYLGNYHPEVDVSHCRMAIGEHEVFADGAFRLTPDIERALFAYFRHAELYASAAPDGRNVFRPTISWPPHERCERLSLTSASGRPRPS
jgi:glutamate N-acetyltransferase / amino-acid N-acetyltransferase